MKKYCLLFLIVCLSFGFCITLTHLTIEKQRSLVFNQAMVTAVSSLESQLQRAIRYGKQLESQTTNSLYLQQNIDQINRTLTRMYKANPTRLIATNLSLYNVDGVKIWSFGGAETVLIEGSRFVSIHDPKIVKSAALIHTLIPVDAQLQTKYVLVVTTDKSIIDQLSKNNFMMLVKWGFMGCVLAAIAIPLCMGSRLRTYSVLITLLLGFISLQTYLFYTSMIDTASKRLEDVAQPLSNDLSKLLNRGVNLSFLSDGDSLLSEMIQSNSDIESISVKERNSGVSWFSRTDDITENHLWLSVAPKINLLSKTLYLTDGRPAGQRVQITMVYSQTYMYHQLREMLLNLATVLVVTLLLVMEAIPKTSFSNGNTLVKPPYYNKVRPIAVVTILGSSMCLSFIPIYMQSLSMGAYPWSPSILMALPISAEMIGLAFSQFYAGRWVDKNGVTKPLATSLILIAGGNWLCTLAVSQLTFIIVRLIVGVGMGMFFTALQTWSYSLAKHSERNQASASMWAGAFSGSLIGVTTGAILSEYLGFKDLFLLSAVFPVMALVLLLAARCQSTNSETDGGFLPKVRHQDSVTVLKQLLCDRSYLLLLFFSFVPAAIVYSGLSSYLIPVYLRDIGVTQASIGRFYLIHGLIMIFVAPWLAKRIDAKAEKKHVLIYSGLLGIVGVASFGFVGGILGIVTMVFCVALSESVQIARTICSQLPIVQKVGVGQSIALFNTLGRFGYVFGPLIFGSLMASQQGIQHGMIWVGLGYVVLMITLMLGLESKADNTLEVA